MTGDLIQAPPSAPGARRKRVPAEERREQVIEAAMDVVSRAGIHGASTAEIAQRAGISHAYLFRLFPTKDELMIAVTGAAGQRMHQEMIKVGELAKARGEDPLEAMGLQWVELLADRTALRVSLQAIAAAELIPALGEQLRTAWEGVICDIERVSGADSERVRAFVAEGMLLKIIAGLGAEQSDWATRLHNGPLPCGNDGAALVAAGAASTTGASPTVGVTSAGAEPLVSGPPVT